jgi:hypothetical protein
MRRNRLASLSAAFCMAILAGVPAGAASAEPAAAQAAETMAGIWDLTWQTRHGPERKGYLVVRQSGVRLDAEIHGRGSVKAKGTLAGNSFTLRGSRLAIPYTISGRVEGGWLAGSLKILSVERRFTGARR